MIAPKTSTSEPERLPKAASTNNILNLYPTQTDQDTELREKVLNALKDNEQGDGRLFIEKFNGIFCYDHSDNCWYKYNGDCWMKDTIDEVFASVGEIVEIYSQYSISLSRQKLDAVVKGNRQEVQDIEKVEKEILKRIHDIQSEQRRKRILKFAASGDKSLAITGEEWDLDPWLFGCKNGVLNLKTGVFEKSNPKHFIKKSAPVEWKGINTPAPKWEKFMLSICKEDTEMVSYLQRLFGYAITGLSTEHILPVFWGMGRNGKSVLLETISHLLGPLAGCVQTDTILQQKGFKNSSSASPEIVALKGLRLAWCSETSDEKSLNETKVKLLTGGDTLSARQLYSSTINFTPTHTLFLLTNRRPKVDGTDYAIWQRIHLVPFEVSFVDEPQYRFEMKRNPDLLAELKEESSGILAWLVKGCIEWQKTGLNPPDLVKNKTSEYRAINDVIGSFLSECCDHNPGSMTKASDLYERYKKWCKKTGHEICNSTKFGIQMSNRFEKKKGHLVLYVGVSLRDSNLDLYATGLEEESTDEIE